MEDFDSIMTSVAEIDAEKAEAQDIKDKNMIFDAVRKTEGGFVALNNEVMGLIRLWHEDTAASLVEKFRDTSNGDNTGQTPGSVSPRSWYKIDPHATLQELQLAVRVAKFYQDRGNKEAEPLIRAACEVLFEKFGQEHEDTLRAQHCFGEIMLKAGKYDEAAGAFQHAMRGRLKVLGISHNETLSTMDR